jgi:ATP synthase F1 gamma subunit
MNTIEQLKQNLDNQPKEKLVADFIELTNLYVDEIKEHCKTRYEVLQLNKAMDILLPKYLNNIVWKALLESNAAEQAARMMAMETATINARDLIKALQLSYNKARQASITTEMLEIVGGAEALKK